MQELNVSISDFNKPTDHPWGMLEGHERAFEKESVLAWILDRMIIQGSFDPVQCANEHPSMVRDRLLVDAGGKGYSLTPKAIKLLHGVYGK